MRAERGRRQGWRRALAGLLVVLIWPTVWAEPERVVPEGAVEIRHATWLDLSPDGGRMVFEWLGDLWLADAGGGEAVRVVEHPARDWYPKFTRDGRRLVFSSDREGGLEVHSVALDGTDLRRHGRHSEGQVVEDVSPCGAYALVRGRREHGRARQSALLVVDLREERRERRLLDASGHSARWSPDGRRLLFCRGGEALYRQGYEGSRRSIVWSMDLADGRMEECLREAGEVRWPLWHPDGGGFYFVSARDGSFNLWSRRFDGGEDRPMTRLRGEGVIQPALSADGRWLAFHVGGGIRRLRVDGAGEPEDLVFWTREPLRNVATERVRVRGASDLDWEETSGRLVFAARGEMFVQEGEGEARRLTRSAEGESDVAFLAEGAGVVFLRDDGLGVRVMRARIGAEGLEDERCLVAGEGSRSSLRPSPDGRWLAWVEGTGDLVCRPSEGDGVEARRVLAGWSRPWFDWSPCGRWLAVSSEDRHGNRDIRLVAPDAGREPLRLTRHPAYDGSPRWSADGRYLAFTSRRKPGGDLSLWRIDWGEAGAPEVDAAEEAILGRAAQACEIPLGGMEPIRLVAGAEEGEFWFQNRDSRDVRLWAVGAEGRSLPREVLAGRGIPVRRLAGGEILWRVDRSPELVAADGTTRRFAISVGIDRPRREIMQLAFRRCWRTLGERFYDPTMNGRDWPALRLRYEEDVAHCRDARQFDRVVTRMLGELNASHLVLRRDEWPAAAEKPRGRAATAHPGMVFDDREDAADAALRVKRVIPGSPISRVEGAPRPGERIVRIAGEVVTHGSQVEAFFEGMEDGVVPVVVRAEDGRERTLRLSCISHARARALEREAARDAARRLAEERGRIAYLPLERMKREDLDELLLRIHEAEDEADGMVLDLRNNSGGRVADELLAVFHQPEHSFTIPRGGPRGYPAVRRLTVAWHKPLVVLCDSQTYSNAEIFCHALLQTGRAPLVGEETAGGVISAVMQRIPDAGRLQVPFRGWYQARSGADLDRAGARPTHRVELTPEDEQSGRDPQLAVALDLLERMIEVAPEPVAPGPRR